MALMNLYPPIVDTYMPAFLYTESCKIYFSLSPYNSFNDIKYAQVVLTYQNSNLTALNSKHYPNEIKVCDMVEDSTIGNTNKKYYITINQNDLNDESFLINNYYKVQIRFVSKEAKTLTELNNVGAYKETVAWLLENRDYFSEWSTVCLIRGIAKPVLKMADYITNGNSSSSRSLQVLGSLSFNPTYEKETLKSYQIFLQENGNKIIEKTNIIYTNILNPNEINYTLKSLLKKDTQYNLIIKFVTKNLYESQQTFSINTTGEGIDFKDLNLVVSINNELDAANVLINFNTFKQLTGDQLWIKRASVKDSFQTWEYMHQLLNDEYKQTSYSWNDFSLESGVWYKYALEVIRDSNIIDMIVCEDPILTVLENMYLVRNYRQLNIQLNPQVSSYQRVVSDTVTTTLGSKYPFISRNGNSNYRQFTISGLISSYMDDNSIFTNKDEIYLLNKDLYLQFNKERNISEYKDYQYEYHFREKVLDFLYNEQAKLFRSPTEGNILVKLTNISLTPNQTLGRLLYSFTATVIEIDECTPQNLMKYGVVKKGEDSDIFDEAALMIYEYDSFDNSFVIPSYSVDNSSLVITTYSNEI